MNAAVLDGLAAVGVGPFLKMGLGLDRTDGEKLHAFSRRGYDGRLSFVVARLGVRDAAAGFRRAHCVGGRVNWTAVLDLKLRWKTSLEALVYLAYSLGYIDAIKRRRAYR